MIAELLKKSVLQAAIQGKLTEQFIEDGNAKDILLEIQEEKAGLRINRITKNEFTSLGISVDDIPFDIPDNWCWARLGEIVINRDAERKPVSKILRENLKKEFDYYGASGIIDKIDNYIFSEELLLLGEDGANLLNRSTPIAFIARGKYWVNNHAHVIQMPKNLNIEYLCFFINAIDLTHYVTGTAQPKMTQQKMNSIPVSIPPIPEQLRIVAKLNEVLSEIDMLKNDETNLDDLQKKFPKKMKDSILQYAIQGKLTIQKTDDGDARDLLKEFRNQKSIIINKSKVKFENKFQEIMEDEIPFDIPVNWCWARLGEIGIWSAGATPNRSNRDFHFEGTIPWLLTGDLNDGVIRDIPGRITTKALDSTSVKMLQKGTVLIAMYGATIGKIGILDIEATTNQACCGCTPYKGINNWYLFYFLMSHKSEFIKLGVGGAQPNISKEKIINELIPIPPIDEQTRIVRKLKEILPLCGTLD